MPRLPGLLAALAGWLLPLIVHTEPVGTFEADTSFQKRELGLRMDGVRRVLIYGTLSAVVLLSVPAAASATRPATEQEVAEFRTAARKVEEITTCGVVVRGAVSSASCQWVPRADYEPVITEARVSTLEETWATAFLGAGAPHHRRRDRGVQGGRRNLVHAHQRKRVRASRKCSWPDAGPGGCDRMYAADPNQGPLSG